MLNTTPDDLFKIIEVLNSHGVQYVIVGGYGARLLGSGMSTKDIDICPQDSIENFTKLLTAMKELNARYKNAPDGVDIPFEPWLFRNMQNSKLGYRLW